MAKDASDDALVQELASLARLELSDAERAALPGHLAAILAHVECLSELDLDAVEPFVHGIARAHLRDDDAPTERLGAARVCDLAPESERGRVRVPPVLGGHEEGS